MQTINADALLSAADVILMMDAQHLLEHLDTINPATTAA